MCLSKNIFTYCWLQWYCRHSWNTRSVFFLYWWDCEYLMLFITKTMLSILPQAVTSTAVTMITKAKSLKLLKWPTPVITVFAVRTIITHSDTKTCVLINKLTWLEVDKCLLCLSWMWKEPNLSVGGSILFPPFCLLAFPSILVPFPSLFCLLVPFLSRHSPY